MELNAEKVVVINRWKGGPGKIELYLLNETGLCLTSPLIYLRGVKLRREFGNMPRGRRIKFMAMLTSPKCLEEVSKLEKTLSMFFNVPIIRAIDECKTLDAVMQVTASQTKELTVTFRLLPENIEIGPRMRISHLIWDLTHES
ncbi:MAG: hypothetical protein QXD34_04410 [Candidatus Bathyarchaeia archaeon]|nr:hypothetical protein [Candidatus Bathyarchaeota archaeon]